MAKKRGGSPLGNAPGSQEAQQSAAKANLTTLTQQLTAELDKAGTNAAEYLREQFGFESVGQNMVWQLASGNTATFNEVTLSFEQVRDETFVTFDVNGRDQSLLTAESLSDLDSLEFQQFYPAVGREIDGKVDVLDGSRRRAWFLLQEGRVKTFRILVTQDEISVSDAKALAKQLQTAKEHNQREIGLQCQLIMNNGDYRQEDVAQILGISRQAVGRALKAASIDSKLIQLFPVVNELSHTDYAILGKVMKVFDSDSKGLNSLIRKIEKHADNAQAEQSQEDRKESLISVIKAELKIVEAKLESDKAEVTSLAQFDSKGMFARKRVKGRNFSYEFGRLSKSVQEALDVAIAQVLEKHK
ncbi:ParB family protein [Vibrio parahaemolyticus]|uniref:ParB family protein n=2 Tax=Vibrio parahaemolyticus TaxID=670 RepID=UPI00111D2CCA|nr:ParB family protein [Vibrio parahaemolyticus]TOA44034.1 chromosome partitioning protein ParB [Vibrio parahaemolyticus]TOA54266.1 chromosome partitioning protein ParB [Vibrio parahaemolyticus]TOG87442.1 chromosome partitioning protein ParB [Vibrio parahaemolyticus]TOO25243.1 chromosome partitioning protein ParB [Vibrio parahaemolyticus]